MAYTVNYWLGDRGGGLDLGQLERRDVRPRALPHGAGVPVCESASKSWTPIHIEANRRALEAIIDIAYKDKLIPRRYSGDDLFDDTTRRLA